MAVPATGAPTPQPAVRLGRLIGRFLLWLLRVTPIGRWLEREFLAGGHVRRAEKNGYRFWGPVVAAILVTEVLGALADWLNRRTILEIKWPTISSTVGHLETLSPILAALVVGSIAAVIFEAVTYPARRRVGGRAVYHRVRRQRPTRFYDWWVVIGIVVIGGIVSVGVLHWDKYEVGYTIYGLFLVFGILVPSALAYFAGRIVSFPGLIFTVRKLERRLHWVAVTIVAGLAILLVHLALYPWPDLVRDSTSYAGLGRSDAIAAAEKKVGGQNLAFRSAIRGEFGGEDAWILSFELPRGFGSTCIVAVRKGATGTTATPSAGCVAHF
jgi:hypothetical protein